MELLGFEQSVAVAEVVSGSVRGQSFHCEKDQRCRKFSRCRFWPFWTSSRYLPCRRQALRQPAAGVGQDRKGAEEPCHHLHRSTKSACAGIVLDEDEHGFFRKGHICCKAEKGLKREESVKRLRTYNFSYGKVASPPSARVTSVAVVASSAYSIGDLGGSVLSIDDFRFGNGVVR